MTLQKISQSLLTAVGLMIPLLFAVQLVRSRLKRKNAGIVIEDPQALDEAQSRVNQVDLKRELTATHTLLDHYSTMQGYSMSYMDQLVEHLSQAGIEAHYTFQESVPVGVTSVVGFTGTFELYVLRGSEEQARVAIQNFRSQA